MIMEKILELLHNIIYMYYILLCDIYRVRKVGKSGAKIIDVDGSYVYRKYQRLINSGESVSPPGVPMPPFCGWEPINENNYKINK